MNSAFPTNSAPGFLLDGQPLEAPPNLPTKRVSGKRNSSSRGKMKAKAEVKVKAKTQAAQPPVSQPATTAQTTAAAGSTAHTHNSELWNQVEDFLSQPPPSLGGIARNAQRASSHTLPGLPGAAAGVAPGLPGAAHSDAVLAKLRRERSNLRAAQSGVGAVARIHGGRNEAKLAAPPAPPSPVIKQGIVAQVRSSRRDLGKRAPLNEKLLAEAFAFADKVRTAAGGPSASGGGASAGMGGGTVATRPPRGEAGGGATRKSSAGRGSGRRAAAAKSMRGSGSKGKLRGTRGGASSDHTAARRKVATGASYGNLGARGKRRGKSGGEAKRDIRLNNRADGDDEAGKGKDRADYDALCANFEQGLELHALREQLAQSQASMRKSQSVLREGMQKGPFGGQ